MSKRVAFPLFFSLALFVITPAPSRGIEEIKIASTGPGVSTLPLEMATRKGFFRDEGLDEQQMMVNDMARRWGR